MNKTKGKTIRRLVSVFVFLLIIVVTGVGINWIQKVDETPPPFISPPVVTVVATIVTPHPYTHQLHLLGTVKPFKEAELSAKQAGPVSNIQTGIELGTRIQSDQLLAEIDPAPFRIEVEYRKALLDRSMAERSKADLVRKHQKLLININLEKVRLAQAEWSRLKGLFKRELTTEQKMDNTELLVRRAQEELQNAERIFEEAKGQFAISVSNVSASKAELDRANQALKDTQIRAPFKGVISEKLVNIGEVVTSGKVLFRLIDDETVRILIRAQARDIVLVRSGQNVTVQVDGLENVFHGHVAHIGPIADARTRTFPIEVLVKNLNKNRLLPGMFARAIIPLRSYSSAILVPRAAVTFKAGEKPFVFVVDDPSGTVRKRSLEISREFGSRLLVSDGLRAGDQLVTSGQHLLKENAKVRIIEKIKGDK